MSNLGGVLPIGSSELLARYIFRKEHVRSDGTVKPDPFIPFKWVELSVTRHRGFTEQEVWSAGEAVAAQIGRAIVGRADAEASVYIRQRLRVVPDPQTSNPNHANVVGWPGDKQAQKEIALEIAREARFTAKPGATTIQ